MSNGTVFVAAGTHLYALDAAGMAGCSGAPKICSPQWTADDGSSYSPGQCGPTVAYDRVFIGGSTGIRAYDATGTSGCGGSPKVCTPLWSAASPASPSIGVANDVVYAWESVVTLRRVVVRELVRHTNHMTSQLRGVAADAAASPPQRCVPANARTLARLAKQVELGLGGVDLSMSQYRVLAFLSEDEAAAASALATRLDVSRPSVTALIDGLVARGLVERRPSTDDRRRVEHRLTADGVHILGVADQAVTRRLDAIVDHVPDRAATAAVHSLEHWGAALGRARDAYIAGRMR